MQELAQPHRVGLDAAEIGVELEAQLRLLRAVIEVGDLAHEAVQVELREIDFRGAGIVAEGVHHVAHGFDLLHDRVRRSIEQLRLRARQAAEIAAANPLGG